MIGLEGLRVLLATALAGSVAMVAVLALRGMVRRRLGASAAYLLWLAVPVAMVAVLLPAPRGAVLPVHAIDAVLPAARTVLEHSSTLSLPWTSTLGGAWLAGALLAMAGLLRQQRRFVRGLGTLRRRDDGLWQAQATAGLPAVLGLWPPRIVLPADFERRYTAQEQRLVLLHEQVHLRRGDIAVNALLAALQCVYWFNPLLPLALRRCREDQEFSCDERVIARSDGARRSYGNAMLKTGLALSSLPLGCHWQDRHPLKERIAMLKRPVPGKGQWFGMLLLAAGVSLALGFAAWAAQPAPSDALATSAAPASAAPPGGDTEPTGVPADNIAFARRSPPRYPPGTHAGRLLLQIDVAADGTATDVRIERGSGHADLDEAAVEAARRWRFPPARKDGKPVAGTVRVPVLFDRGAGRAAGKGSVQ